MNQLFTNLFVSFMKNTWHTFHLFHPSKTKKKSISFIRNERSNRKKKLSSRKIHNSFQLKQIQIDWTRFEDIKPSYSYNFGQNRFTFIFEMTLILIRTYEKSSQRQERHSNQFNGSTAYLMWEPKHVELGFGSEFVMVEHIKYI